MLLYKVYTYIFFFLEKYIFYKLLKKTCELHVRGTLGAGITLTAAWWCVSVCSGVASSPWAQILSTLSLPPLASSLPSGDHSSPHTSWLWPSKDPTWWDATRTSWWWMAPLREPLKRKEYVDVSVFLRMDYLFQLRGLGQVTKLFAISFQFIPCEM